MQNNVNEINSNETTKIYLVANIENDPNKIYIGKTIGTRIYSHKKTYGEQITYDYIDEINSTDHKIWEPLESYWIEQFRQWGFEVMNKNKGGGGVIKHSSETKAKMKISRAKRITTPETRLKMSNSRKGFVFSDESRLKISVGLKGRPLSEERKINIGIGLKGKTRTPEQKAHFSEVRMGEIKPYLYQDILQYDKNGNFIREWDSVQKAALSIGKGPGNISSCLTGYIDSAYGYVWKYKFDVIPIRTYYIYKLENVFYIVRTKDAKAHGIVVGKLKGEIINIELNNNGYKQPEIGDVVYNTKGENILITKVTYF